MHRWILIVLWWACLDLNQGPIGYEPTALTTELQARYINHPSNLFDKSHTRNILSFRKFFEFLILPLVIRVLTFKSKYFLGEEITSMKKLVLGLITLMLSFVLVGCNEVNVSQEGNKVYLGMKPSQVFKFAEKASSYFGLQVLSKDQSNGVIATQVVGSTNLNRYGSSLVSFEIAAKEENAVITVRSTINGEYDEQKSVQAAKEIVRRIIAYLNGFGGGLNK